MFNLSWGLLKVFHHKLHVFDLARYNVDGASSELVLCVGQEKKRVFHIPIDVHSVEFKGVELQLSSIY